MAGSKHYFNNRTIILCKFPIISKLTRIICHNNAHFGVSLSKTPVIVIGKKVPHAVHIDKIDIKNIKMHILLTLQPSNLYTKSL